MPKSLEPVTLNIAAVYHPITCSTSLVHHIALKDLREDVGWTLVQRAHKELLWEAGQDVSIRAFALKACERFAEVAGLTDPF